ncbi:hypothetical protein DFJ58DRAFT_764610 [Suillus subalutaceus]|uniref:uncharacterized protein n=1 Tax=Suillus subalutaceus TaxID=48586 RepID=UPI001B869EE9|nr:uncharacterized protein DFJ58DRAFT_764610 [Suillus subalutaceus]KAG1870091.1 hypothetical protein DFJ58DRAFT_764610 [Suillus subalutaceus]
MSVIEKLQETWTSSSITTSFRIGSLADISPKQALQFPVAGFSWHLVVRQKGPPYRRNHDRPWRCQLSFNSCDCPGTWRGTPVNIKVSIPSYLDGDKPFCVRSDGTVLGTQLLITCSYMQLQDALVSLEVTFTNPLTCNLFNVLANVMLIPDAPLAASAKEPRVPQACSALRALEQSLKTGTSFDIIFQAYTRRLSPGSVTRPIPIYANTAVLQTTTLLPDFAEEDLDFSSLFELSEGDTLPFTSLESYEYESDSDLEDDSDNHSSNSSNHNNSAVVQPAEESTTGDEASASHDERSLTPESPEDTTDIGSISSFSNFEAGPQEQPDNRPLLLEDVKMIGENLTRGFRVVLVKGVAWRTWHAFIYYCYTGIVDFANLRSQSISDVTLQQRPHCSPKSMYQLAMKLQNETLSQLAFKAVAFSKFTSRHDAIREMEIALLLQHRSAPAVLQGLPAKIKAVATGNLPHAASALTALYQQLTQIPG